MGLTVEWQDVKTLTLYDPANPAHTADLPQLRNAEPGNLVLVASNGGGAAFIEGDPRLMREHLKMLLRELEYGYPESTLPIRT